MLRYVFVISLGASLGASLRWILGLMLDSFFQPLQMGILTANLLGAYLIGLALSFFAQIPNLAPEWQLLIITGFLGSLTTFSSFSGEVISLLQNQKISLAFLSISLHLFGSLAMTCLGVLSFGLVKKLF